MVSDVVGGVGTSEIGSPGTHRGATLAEVISSGVIAHGASSVSEGAGGGVAEREGSTIGLNDRL